MAKLIAQSGHSLDLPSRRVTLGESASCDIPLSAGLGLAPIHFEIEPSSDGNYVLRDVSGGSGVTINDQTVQEQVLQHGNVISVGALKLGFWNMVVPQEGESPSEGTPGSVSEFSAPGSGEDAEAQPAVYIPVASLAESGGRAPAAQPPVPKSEPVPPPVAEPVASTPVPAAVPPPVPMPMPAAPQLAVLPVAWVNPAEEKEAERAKSMAAAFPVAPAGGPPAPVTVAPAGKKSGRGSNGRRSRFSGRRVAVLTSVALVAGLAAAAVRVPAVKAAVEPWVAKFENWTNPPKPESKVTAEPAVAKAAPASSTVAAKLRNGDTDRSVTPKAEHNEVVKKMLTERTISLFQADLHQLVPFYNATASTQKLPPQREMTEAFRKNYGLALDSFDKLTCLRANGKDEFVFILSSPLQINLETMLGIPPTPGKERSASKSKSIRIYPVKLTGKLYGAAQYDPFTVLLGRTSWLESALNGGSGPSLREALCMFPYTAAKNPGALIMVERITHADNSTPSAFQTAVSNLYFNGKGDSRLTLTRNPDVKEEVFVEQSSAALKEQASALFQSVKLGGAAAVPSAKIGGTVQDAGEIITTTEASIIIPDGEALLKEAIDSVAQTFMGQSPTVELILAAQKAVLNFNLARVYGAPEAQTVTSVTEALELLQGGITVNGGGQSRVYQIERLEPAQADEIVHLLAMEDRSGLVFRPSVENLKGTMLDLAVKARDYRNAELLISLWSAAKFTKSDAQDVATAARKVLEWASKDGARQRLSVGLPSLTDIEKENALSLLSFQNGQLTWKPGEDGYRTWLRKVNPDPKGDAKRIAGIFSQALQAGAIPSGKVNELAEAVRLISTGVSSSNAARPTVFKAGNFTNDELRAAARYLRLEGGAMTVIDR